jgi:uncharacterized protein YjbI with pentapeptide repeats
MWPIWLTVALAVGAFLAGLYCFFRSGDDHVRNLGVGLLTGTVTTMAVLLLQWTLTEADQQQEELQRKQDQRQEAVLREQAEQQTFELSLALTSDLTGFNPKGRSLAGAYLSGKKLNSAKLEGADLRGAELRGADLTAANLDGANMTRANLLDATLNLATLRKTNLSGANLRGVKFGRAAVETATLKGAEVNANTCWPAGFLEAVAPNAGLVPRPILTDPNNPEEPSFGYTCPEG